ncbi:ARM REPEAT PROTEIN INTERACTING WITH ABF2-like isoform X2 [Arachis ipaensis]|uniref:ARM REPEAT PROTEIN INTERACTING WITH ABF2-like isoform X2 n=1 Tax=Arachis ipaensis TaxID=130454 RepID=UPI000A2B4232|nr:ARM REPEAT PROTEIN INTERACTING WITH ABF2-like isoform X2 [Arachis ipaensis]
MGWWPSRSVTFVDNHDTGSTQELLGKHCVNNSKLSDVTFLVEGKRFYAHRVCLVKSDIFRARFDGGYRVGLEYP